MDNTPVRERLWRGGKSLLQMVITLVIVLAVVALGEILPPMRALDASIRERPALDTAL